LKNSHKKMNLIVVTMDGARLDRIINGHNYKKLIEKSIFFPKTITYAPFTIAAMHAIFSGTYGFKSGVNSYWKTPDFKKTEYKTLSKYLQDCNYYTCGDTINKLVLPKIGFDKLEIHDELNDDLLERHKKLFDEMKIKNDNDENFFLYLHYSKIHTGIMQNVLKKFNNFSQEYFSNIKKNSEYYDKLFNEADLYLGELIKYFNKLELNKNTLLVVISDHGISVGERFGERAYGVFCYDYTLISTSLFFHPKLSPMMVENQVRSVDILPTILELLEIPHDTNYKKMDGESLLPIINGKIEKRISFSQSGNPLDSTKPPKEPNVFAVRTDEWKYIRNIHDSTEELYSLVSDPNEKTNLIDEEKTKSIEMRTLMNEILDS
tara:strand:+ start:2307 stop:3437 length:1131 start_codon:yes stop_codon:yes gene_type:complete